MRFILKLLFAVVISLISSGCTPIPTGMTKFNLRYGVTPISHDIYHLHMLIFWICVAIGIVVFSALFYSIIYHRKSKAHQSLQFHEHPVLEIVWTIIPFVILVSMAIPSTIVLINLNNSEDSAVTIKITASQWKWQYEYLDYGIKQLSNLKTSQDQINNLKPKDPWYLLEVDNPLVIPIHKKIRFLITSNDVVHSWSVPDFGIKRDAIPGFIHEAWAIVEKPGIYRGQCQQLCGTNHGFMPIVVKAVSDKEFQQWVAKEKPVTQEVKQKYSSAELLKLGKENYEKICAVCHQANGTGIPHTFPALRGDPIVKGGPIAQHIGIVLNGKPGTAMQAFRNQLSDLEIAAIITYERNAWGNNTGDVVQPSEVEKQRNR